MYEAYPTICLEFREAESLMKFNLPNSKMKIIWFIIGIGGRITRVEIMMYQYMLPYLLNYFNVPG